MPMAEFPFVIKDANVYIEGNELLGKAEITLPEVVQKMVDFSALGVAGTVALPIAGHVEKMEGTLKFNMLVGETAQKLSDPSKTYMLDARASYQAYNAKSGEMEEKPIQVTMKAFITGIPMGTWKPAESEQVDVKFSAIYLKVVIDGEEVLEVDPLNYIYRANGKDILAQTRANIGLS